MPACQNCATHVTERYAVVFAPRGIDAPRTCPDCEELTRNGATIRERTP